MPPTNTPKNTDDNRPRDTEGRFTYASWGQDDYSVEEATEALEQMLLSGTTDETIHAAQRLLDAVNLVPILTQSEAKRIAAAIESPHGSPIITDIWADLDLRCRNAPPAADDN